MQRTLIAAATATLLSGLFAPGGAYAQDDDDIGSATEAICCGGNCCSIGGMCFTRDQENPANACEVCDPSSSRTSFTAVAGCGEDAGTAADAGTPEVDAGAPAVDAGTPAVDAGTPAVDAGTPAVDAGTTPMTDAGSTPMVDAGTGTDDGGCSVQPGSTSHGTALVGLLALGALFIRRRR